MIIIIQDLKLKTMIITITDFKKQKYNNPF